MPCSVFLCCVYVQPSVDATNITYRTCTKLNRNQMESKTIQRVIEPIFIAPNWIVSMDIPPFLTRKGRGEEVGARQKQTK
mmetsp:Transcript_19395/g.54055  ORF Transcript_19395/g.54055 Transcript_19395/m.54055 type:complete len:80 (+) Transcript_19395:2293-2532(+)